MDDILQQLGSVISSWSQLGTLAGLIGAVNLLTNLTKLQWVQTKVCSLFHMTADTMKKVLPFVALFLGAAGGFLTALQQGKPIPQALVTGVFIGLSAIGVHEVAKKKGDKGDDNSDMDKKSTSVSLLLITFSVFAIVISQPGCRWFASNGGNIAEAFVDCAKADSTKFQDLSRDLRPLVFNGTNAVDWKLVEGKAKEAGITVGGCVLAELVQEFLMTNKGATANETWSAHDSFEHFRRLQAKGATFKNTKYGDL